MDDGKSMDQSGVDFGATTPLIRPDGGTVQLRPSQSPPPRPSQPKPGPPKRRIPIWAWIVAAVGGFIFLAVVGLALVCFLFSQPGFSAVVRGAPPGSDVYIDNGSRGATSDDG